MLLKKHAELAELSHQNQDLVSELPWVSQRSHHTGVAKGIHQDFSGNLAAGGRLLS